MILMVALIMGATTNLTKILLSRKICFPLEIVVWYSFIGWILLTPWMVFEIWSSGIPTPSSAEWTTVAYLGVISTVLAYVLFRKRYRGNWTDSKLLPMFSSSLFSEYSVAGIIRENIGIHDSWIRSNCFRG